MEYIIATGVIAIIIFGIAIFRKSSNGSAMGDSIKRAGKIGKGIDSARDSNQRTKDGLDELGKVNQSAQERTDDISKHNKSAKSGIRSAIDILKNAKNRKPNP